MVIIFWDVPYASSKYDFNFSCDVLLSFLNIIDTTISVDWTSPLMTWAMWLLHGYWTWHLVTVNIGAMGT